MKNLKNMVAAIMMVAVLMVGTTFAGTGMLLSDLAGNNQNPCGQTTEQTNGGIILHEFTGIIIHAFTGIIIHELAGNTGNTRNQTQCRNGMLLSD